MEDICIILHFFDSKSIYIMKKYIFILLLPFITSCANTMSTIEQSSNFVQTNIDWVAASNGIDSSINNKIWKSIPRSSTLPFNEERKKSKFIGGYISNNGNYIFISIITPPKNRKVDANEMLSITDPTAFSNAFKLSSEIKQGITKTRSGIPAVHFSMQGNGNGYGLIHKKGIPTQYDVFYLPIELDGKYYSIIEIDYRGTTSTPIDYQDFLGFVHNIKLPNNLKPTK